MSIEQFIKEHKEFANSVNKAFKHPYELEASWNWCIYLGVEVVPFNKIETVYKISLDDLNQWYASILE